MKNKLLSSNLLLLLFIVLENLFLYYFYKRGYLSQGKNAWGLFCSSILFGGIFLYKFYNTSIAETKTENKVRQRLIYFAILMLGLIFIGNKYGMILKNFAVDTNTSDIIPLIMHMTKNFLHMRSPYTPVNFFGTYGVPTYLPMQWFPFTAAYLLNIDYRWVPYAVWCIAALLICFRVLKSVNNAALHYLVMFLFLSSIYTITICNDSIIYATIELLIAAYYMLLISGLNQQNGIIQGLLISFCLLSRFSVVLWLPLYAFTLFFSYNRKVLYQSVATVIIVVFLGYLLPFVSNDWLLLFRNHKAYDVAALYEWGRHNFDNKPEQLFSGTGFAYFIYTRFPRLSIADRVKLIQQLHLFLSLFVTVILGVWYWFKRDKINYKIFLLGSFKIYLAVFLFLIQVPYEYLMSVGNFVSIAIFCEQLRYKIENDKMQEQPNSL